MRFYKKTHVCFQKTHFKIYDIRKNLDREFRKRIQKADLLFKKANVLLIKNTCVFLKDAF